VHKTPLCTKEHDPDLASFAILVATDPEKSATKVGFPGAKNKFLCQQWGELPVQQGSLWSLIQLGKSCLMDGRDPSLPLFTDACSLWPLEARLVVFVSSTSAQVKHALIIFYGVLYCVFLSHFEMETCQSSIKESTQQRGRKRYNMEGPKSWSFLLYHCP
jgi:hypothetical protein